MVSRLTDSTTMKHHFCVLDDGVAYEPRAGAKLKITKDVIKRKSFGHVVLLIGPTLK